MSTIDGRYKLIRWHFKTNGDGWQRKATDRYRTKAEAMSAYHRARIEDGAWLIDDETGEYIA